MILCIGTLSQTPGVLFKKVCLTVGTFFLMKSRVFLWGKIALTRQKYESGTQWEHWNSGISVAFYNVEIIFALSRLYLLMSITTMWHSQQFSKILKIHLYYTFYSNGVCDPIMLTKKYRPSQNCFLLFKQEKNGDITVLMRIHIQKFKFSDSASYSHNDCWYKLNSLNTNHTHCWWNLFEPPTTNISNFLA